MAKRIIIYSLVVFFLLIPVVNGLMRWFESINQDPDSSVEYTILFCSGTALAMLMLAGVAFFLDSAAKAGRAGLDGWKNCPGAGTEGENRAAAAGWCSCGCRAHA
jgi:hypothetical protein